MRRCLEVKQDKQAAYEILNQLIMMDLLHSGTELFLAHTQLFKSGWPAFDLGFGSSQDELNKRAVDGYNNVQIFG